MKTKMKLTGNRCECTGCGEYFASVTAFDAHRIGEPGQRRCRSREEMRSKGFHLDKYGYLSNARKTAGSEGWMEIEA